MSEHRYNDLKVFCRLPFHRIKISSDGMVNMCSYQAQWGIGNIIEQSFEEIWLGKTARDIREEVLRNRLHSNCSTQNCPFLTSVRKPIDIDFNKFPIELEIDLPMQHCNTTCIMCERNLNYKEQDDKLQQICEKIKPYVMYLKDIMIVGIAEPFWKGKIFEILNWLEFDSFKETIKVVTITNGSCPEVLDFLKFKKSCITFSLDSSTEETHKIIRKTNFNDVVSNLMAYASKRTSSQRLRIYNNINLFNLREVESMVEMAHQAKVDELDFNATAGLHQLGVNEDNAYLFFQAQNKIIRRAKELGVNVSFSRNLYLDYDVDKNNNRVVIDSESMSKYLKIPKELIDNINLRYNRRWMV